MSSRVGRRVGRARSSESWFTVVESTVGAVGKVAVGVLRCVGVERGGWGVVVLCISGRGWVGGGR